MGRIDQRIEELGLTLPEPFAAADREFNFVLAKVHDGLCYIAGHGPFDGVVRSVQGRLGDDLTIEQG